MRGTQDARGTLGFWSVGLDVITILLCAFPVKVASRSGPAKVNHGQGWSTAHQMWILRVRQAAQSGSRARCETCGDERGGRATCRSCVRAPRWRRWSTKPVILQRHPTSARASREIYVHRANSIFMLQVQRSERSTLARSRLVDSLALIFFDVQRRRQTLQAGCTSAEADCGLTCECGGVA